MDNNSQENKKNSRREYRSEKRRKQAQETQQTILEAGRRLFVEQGYTATTIAQIADAAGVSEPTIYSSVGGKRGILLALVDFVGELGDQTIVHESSIERDPHRYIQLVMKYNRQIHERGRDVIKLVISTAPIDPEVSAALDKARKDTRKVAGEIAEGLHKRAKLRPHLSLKQVGDIISLMMMPDLYDTLYSYGWSFDDCEAWATDSLIQMLLQPET